MGEEAGVEEEGGGDGGERRGGNDSQREGEGGRENTTPREKGMYKEGRGPT